jgi:hypothetical protein
MKIGESRGKNLKNQIKKVKKLAWRNTPTAFNATRKDISLVNVLGVPFAKSLAMKIINAKLVITAEKVYTQ